jgi:hypothetical protein
VRADLHAQVHFADLSYCGYCNDPQQFRHCYDRVHYELIVSDELLLKDALGRRRITHPRSLMPSLSDQKTAIYYDLTCQIDVVDYSQPNWICNDYSREESRHLQQKSRQLSMPVPGVEVLQALVRPSTPAQDGLKTKLFSNLFLPVKGFTSRMRTLLWIVPVPELLILLLGWSSLSPRPWGISSVAAKVLESLIQGDLSTARKLVFSQMIVSGQANVGSASLLIGTRNQHAMEVLNHSMERDECQ